MGCRVKYGALAVAFLVIASCSAPIPSTAQESEGRTIRLDLHSGRPVLQAQINGRGPFPMIFDTGAGAAVVLDSLKRELSLEVRGQTPLGSPLGDAPPTGDIVRLETVSIGGIRRDNLQAVSIADTLLPLRGARGVLGPSVIPDRIVEIDVSGGTLWIGPAPRQTITHWNRITHGGKLETSAVVGDVRFPVVIDTGSQGVFLLPTELAGRLQLREPLRPGDGLRTIDASRITALGRLDTDAAISGATLRLETVSFADFPIAILGMRGLAGFTIVVDYGRGRWAMVGQSQRPLVARLLWGDFGMRTMPELDGRASVLAVQSGSRAFASGIQVGDQIASINGAPIALAPPQELETALTAPGARVTVIRAGATIELVTP